MRQLLQSSSNYRCNMQPLDICTIYSGTSITWTAMARTPWMSRTFFLVPLLKFEHNSTPITQTPLLLELFSSVPCVFEPLKFDFIYQRRRSRSEVDLVNFLSDFDEIFFIGFLFERAFRSMLQIWHSFYRFGDIRGLKG